MQQAVSNVCQRLGLATTNGVDCVQGRQEGEFVFGQPWHSVAAAYTRAFRIGRGWRFTVQEGADCRCVVYRKPVCRCLRRAAQDRKVRIAAQILIGLAGLAPIQVR